MKAAIYCASAYGNKKIFESSAKELIDYLTRCGVDIIFGASNTGLMSVVANTALENGASVTGVVPSLPLIYNARHKGLTDYIFTDTIAERRSKMIEGADAFIALPGGPGTLDEITEVICLCRLGVIDRPCVFYNVEGYYEPVRQMFESIYENGFAPSADMKFLLFSSDKEEIYRFITEYNKR